MGDVISSAAREMWDMLVAAITSPRPWLYAALAVVPVLVITVIFRGRRTMWLLLPVLGGLVYWGWRRFAY